MISITKRQAPLMCSVIVTDISTVPCNKCLSMLLTPATSERKDNIDTIRI